MDDEITPQETMGYVASNMLETLSRPGSENDMLPGCQPAQAKAIVSGYLEYLQQNPGLPANVLADRTVAMGQELKAVMTDKSLDQWHTLQGYMAHANESSLVGMTMPKIQTGIVLAKRKHPHPPSP